MLVQLQKPAELWKQQRSANALAEARASVMDVHTNAAQRINDRFISDSLAKGRKGDFH